MDRVEVKEYTNEKIVFLLKNVDQSYANALRFHKNNFQTTDVS
jgi:DNA-directed RNA polymerase alpha subunit